jgi:hypothetical protein
LRREADHLIAEAEDERIRRSIVAEDAADHRERYKYEAVTCLACKRIHLANPTTGKVLGDE